MTTCPMCGLFDIDFTCRHKEFNCTIYFCANCGHGWSEYSIPFIGANTWKTTKWRADKYLDYLESGLQVNTLLEIGSGCDFYFLKQLHLRRPDIKLYLHDNCDYSFQLPEYVTFIKDLKKMPAIDVLYMNHSLEHIIQPFELLDQVKDKIQDFLLEIPVIDLSYYPNLKREKTFTTAWHYHFYSKKSFKLLCDAHGLKIKDQFDDLTNLTKNYHLGCGYLLERVRDHG